MSNLTRLLKPNEQILRKTDCRPSVGILIVMTVLFFGLPVFYYIYSIRKQPMYIITNMRILEVKNSEIRREILYDDIKQIQIGTSWPEKFDRSGHIVLVLYDTESLKLQHVNTKRNAVHKKKTKIIF